MVEGTRLGEINDEVNLVSNTETDTQRHEATKMGEVSEFEREFLGENVGVTVNENGAIDTQDVESSATDSNEDAMDDLFQQEVEKDLLDYQEGDLIRGVIRSIEKSGILVDINYKSDGFIANSEFSIDQNASPSELYAPGDPIYVVIERLESKDGYTILSRKKAEYEEAWNAIIDSQSSREPLTLNVNSKVQGGLVVSYKSIKGFVPASQVAKESSDDLEALIGKTLLGVTIQADRRRRKVIFSNKYAQSYKTPQLISEILDKLQVGDICDGKVTSVKDFGAFVDIGGVEGLVHISELSWCRVSHPSEFVSVGQEVKVFVLGVDKESNRVSLGMKQLLPDPWVNVEKTYQNGQVITGVITRIVPFGAFIKLDENLEGLIHISELADHDVRNVQDVVSVGQQVEARIVKLLPEEQKIGLSIKQVDQDAASELATQTPSQEESAASDLDSTNEND